jgi:hypothetical protein
MLSQQKSAADSGEGRARLLPCGCSGRGVLAEAAAEFDDAAADPSPTAAVAAAGGAGSGCDVSWS